MYSIVSIVAQNVNRMARDKHTINIDKHLNNVGGFVINLMPEVYLFYKNTWFSYVDRDICQHVLVLKIKCDQLSQHIEIHLMFTHTRCKQQCCFDCSNKKNLYLLNYRKLVLISHMIFRSLLINLNFEDHLGPFKMT